MSVYILTMKKQALTPAEKNCRSREKKKASMSATEQLQYNQNRAKSEQSLTPAERNCRLREKKKVSMSATEQLQYNQNRAKSE